MKVSILLGAVLLVFVPASALAGTVGLIRIDGAIGPATASYVSRAVVASSERNDQCLIIELDTPGGLMDSMKKIVDALYNSKAPTVVFVTPTGTASATSAGCFITMAADIAAMAPYTRIGAAHPVIIGNTGEPEKTDDVMKRKMENDAASLIEGIANKRHRNAEWARAAVLQSTNVTAEQALNLNVIDLIASDLPDLLKQLDGRKAVGKMLHTKGATIVGIPMSAWERFSQMFLRPEIMFILMLVVIYGIIGELSSPGAILPGVAGAIALIIVLYMSSVLPVNVAGLVLIGLAVALFITDIYAPTHGVLTVGGIVSFFLGSLMLFNHAAPGFKLSIAYIIPATLITAAFFIFIVGAGLRAQFNPVRAGSETMLGRTVNALSRIDAQGGKVFIEGELWNAASDTEIEKDQPVEIVGIVGLTLRVKPKTK
ncbi:MAG: nodulation protein NfeD [Verrucomicrobia bacterium]|nr:nodulation protein NfeD [Verrucomicrobiota bacterium]